MAVDIKNFIIERIKAQDPEIDVREGSGIYDLLINPLSSILTSYQADHTDIKNRQGITDISQLPRITRYLSSLRNGIGSKKYTYILSDHHVIPGDHSQYYSEEVIYLPDTFMPFTPQNFENNVKITN